jgi:hypothetical protein
MPLIQAKDLKIFGLLNKGVFTLACEFSKYFKGMEREH